jgi:hypothetical protein
LGMRKRIGEALAHAVSGLAEFDKLEEVSVRFKIYAGERGDTKLGVGDYFPSARSLELIIVFERHR